jgi:hypothetical protein
MPSAASSSAVAGRPLAQSTTSGPVTHAEPFQRSTTAAMSPPGVTGRMRTALPFDKVIADSSSRNMALYSLRYLITRSARDSSADGMVRPSLSAVTALIVSSKFVGSSTGKLPALAPLKILSTNCAECRYNSA